MSMPLNHPCPLLRKLYAEALEDLYFDPVMNFGALRMLRDIEEIEKQMFKLEKKFDMKNESSINHSAVELNDVVNLVRSKFQSKVDMSNWDVEILSAEYLYRANYQNNFVMIRELRDADYLDITFFKSDRINEKIFDDYLDLGITFKPKNIEEVKIILNSVDA